MNDEEIKVIKLLSGEEIVARINDIDSETIISLDQPYIVQFNDEGLALFQWIIAADYLEPVNISALSIVSISNPKEKILEGYHRIVRADIVSETSLGFEDDDEGFSAPNLTLH